MNNSNVSVDVNYEDLISFKDTLNKNREEFENIRTSLGATINEITNTDWQDAKSDEFRDLFMNVSDKDFQTLESTMEHFAKYLDSRIAILQEYHAAKLENI